MYKKTWSKKEDRIELMLERKESERKRGVEAEEDWREEQKGGEGPEMRVGERRGHCVTSSGNLASLRDPTDGILVRETKLISSAQRKCVLESGMITGLEKANIELENKKGRELFHPKKKGKTEHKALISFTLYAVHSFFFTVILTNSVMKDYLVAV